MSEKRLIGQLGKLVEHLRKQTPKGYGDWAPPKRSSFAETPSKPDFNLLLINSGLQIMNVPFIDRFDQMSGYLIPVEGIELYPQSVSDALKHALVKVEKLIDSETISKWSQGSLQERSDPSHPPTAEFIRQIGEGAITVSVGLDSNTIRDIQLSGTDIKNTLSLLTPEILKEAAREVAMEESKKEAARRTR